MYIAARIYVRGPEKRAFCRKGEAQLLDLYQPDIGAVDNWLISFTSHISQSGFAAVIRKTVFFLFK